MLYSILLTAVVLGAAPALADWDETRFPVLDPQSYNLGRQVDAKAKVLTTIPALPKEGDFHIYQESDGLYRVAQTVHYQVEVGERRYKKYFGGFASPWHGGPATQRAFRWVSDPILEFRQKMLVHGGFPASPTPYLDVAFMPDHKVAPALALVAKRGGGTSFAVAGVLGYRYGDHEPILKAVDEVKLVTESREIRVPKAFRAIFPSYTGGGWEAGFGRGPDRRFFEYYGLAEDGSLWRLDVTQSPTVGVERRTATIKLTPVTKRRYASDVRKSVVGLDAEGSTPKLKIELRRKRTWVAVPEVLFQAYEAQRAGCERKLTSI
jgi:hypothetical protein